MAQARIDGNAATVTAELCQYRTPLMVAQWLRRLRGTGAAGKTLAIEVSERNEPMFRKIRRLFVIKTRFEAFLIIYALALGATERGSAYLTQYPGWGGKLLFLACTGAVFMAGAKILDCLKHEQAQRERELDHKVAAPSP